MDMAKVRGCLAVSILLLLLLEDYTSACYCRPPIALHTAFCAFDVVIGGSFVDARFEREDMTWAIYGFKVKDFLSRWHEVQGKGAMQNKYIAFAAGELREITWFRPPEKVFRGPVNAGEKIDLYTQLLGTTCGYRHMNEFSEDEYVVTGRLDGDHIVISVCSFIQSWSELTSNKRQGVEQLYNTYCE